MPQLRERDPVTHRFLPSKWPGLWLDNLAELPEDWGCGRCEETKSVDDMMIVRKRKPRRGEKKYYLRPRCKECHNKNERGHRRQYKTKYLQTWRTHNKALNDSYWKDNPVKREQCRVNSARRLSNQETHEAVLIQGRLRRRLNERVSLAEAKGLLGRFGRCYPTALGLSQEGQREVERIRKKGAKRRYSLIQIRIMVYEDGLFIPPDKQPIPYQSSANNLRNWQAKQRQLREQEEAERLLCNERTRRCQRQNSVSDLAARAPTTKPHLRLTAPPNG
jgi:hypothetical protein